MDEQVLRLARSFGSVADAYERARPSYPAPAAAWLAGSERRRVLELGAGTGKLTEPLSELGHDIVATDPDESMLRHLTARLPRAATALAVAEQIPLADASVDVVVTAQAFHWFDLDRALPEIARVLRPGGALALVWNQRDEAIPWARKLGALIGSWDQHEDPAAALVSSTLFGFVDQASYRFWQLVNRETLRDMVLSRSNVAVLDEEARRAKLDEVLAFYDDYGRGPDGMQLPWITRCFKATVVPQRRPAPVVPAPDPTPNPPVDRPPPSDGSDTDSLLIDFH